MLPAIRSWIRFSRKQQSSLFFVLGLQIIVIAWADYTFYFPEMNERPVEKFKIIDLNTADSLELNSLPGIGPVLSSRILKFRNRIGCFQYRDDLLRVYGIQKDWFEQNKKYLSVSNCNPKLFYKKDYSKQRRKWVKYESKNYNRPGELLNLNEVDSTQLSLYQLLPERNISYLLSERKKLGCFTGWVQVARVWGMQLNWLDTLQAWTYLGECRQQLIPQRKKLEQKVIRVNLNLADSMEMKSIPGIRPSLIGKIIRFRSKMRFFHSYDQVLEMRNPPNEEEWAKILPYFQPIVMEELPDSVFIYVNKDPKESMRLHPYIENSLAERIENYRIHHGKFVSLESMRKIYGVKPGTWEKLAPYLRF